MDLKELYAKLSYYDKSIRTNNATISRLKKKPHLSPEETHLLRSLYDANASLENSRQEIMPQYTSHIAQMSVL